MREENNGFAGMNVTEPSTWQTAMRVNNNGTVDMKCKVCGELRDIYTPHEHEILNTIRIPQESSFSFGNNTATCIMTIKPDGTVFFKDKEVVGDDDFKAMIKEIHSVLCGKPTLKFDDSISICDMEISDDGCPRYGVTPTMKGWSGQ